MKRHLLVFIIIIFITLIATIISTIGINYSGKENILHCRDNELSSYEKSVYINGEKIQNSASVVVYCEKIYFSVGILKKCISDTFVATQDDIIMIRRTKIPKSVLLRSESETYIEYEALVQFLHVNNNVYNASGEIYIDSIIPLSINLQGKTYFLEKETMISNANFPPDVILNDGRGAWNVNGDLVVEDDWGNAYKYEVSKDTIQ